MRLMSPRRKERDHHMGGVKSLPVSSARKAKPTFKFKASPAEQQQPNPLRAKDRARPPRENLTFSSQDGRCWDQSIIQKLMVAVHIFTSHQTVKKITEWKLKKNCRMQWDE